VQIDALFINKIIQTVFNNTSIFLLRRWSLYRGILFHSFMFAGRGVGYPAGVIYIIFFLTNDTIIVSLSLRKGGRMDIAVRYMLRPVAHCKEGC